MGPIISLAASVAAAGGSQRESLGVVFGTCLAASIVPIAVSPFIRFAGKMAMTDLRSLPWIAVSTPLCYGLGFRAAALVPCTFLHLITAFESIGDLTATSACASMQAAAA